MWAVPRLCPVVVRVLSSRPIPQEGPPALPLHSGFGGAASGSPQPRSRLLSRPGRRHPLSPQIYYWEAGGPNATEKVKVLFLPETAVRLKNLTSHSRYLVSIAAFNAAGDGPRSEPRPGRTHQAGRRGRASAPAARGAPLRTASSPRPSHSSALPVLAHSRQPAVSACPLQGHLGTAVLRGLTGPAGVSRHWECAPEGGARPVCAALPWVRGHRAWFLGFPSPEGSV